MIPDLLLALASVAVLLSPLPLDALRGQAFRRRQEAKETTRCCAHAGSAARWRVKVVNASLLNAGCG